MCNSIWKKPDQKPEKENHIVLVGAWATCLWYGGEKPEEIFWENVKRWAYLEEIIAQADKAERLQKAVDIAEEALKYARQRGLDNTATLFAVGTKADKALDEIRQLIKETQ